MSYCPNCHATVAHDADSCGSCGGKFPGSFGWAPMDGDAPIEPKPTSIAGLIIKLGFASIWVPALGFIVGLILSTIIPGCHCDEGAGCHGCGANEFVGLLLFGGFVGALVALGTIFPASLLLAGIVSLLTRNRT